jgi:hypothetical protein
MKGRWLLLAPIGWLLAAPAGATTLTYGSYSLPGAQIVTITDTQDTSPAVNEEGYAGPIVLNDVNGNSSATVTAWCVDIVDWLQTSGSYVLYNILPGTTGIPGDTGTPLATVANEIGAIIQNANAAIASDTTGNAPAALQMAIWELEYPNIQIVPQNSDLTSLAASYVTDVQNGTWVLTDGYQLGLLDGSATGNQSLAFISQVPEPASVAVLLFGLLGLGLVRFQKDAARTA